MTRRPVHGLRVALGAALLFGLWLLGLHLGGLDTGLLFLMLWLIFRREITTGQFFALWIYSFFLFGPLQEFGTRAATKWT